MPSIQVDRATLAQLIAAGLIPEPGNKGKGKKKAAEVLAEAHPAPNVWVVPYRAASTANLRAWRVRSNHTQLARKAVSAALGRHLADVVPFAAAFHAGRVVRVVLTRIGGARLDGMANLGMSLKGIEDATAMMMGASDGAANWRAEARQEPGAAQGVRIELFVEGV